MEFHFRLRRHGYDGDISDERRDITQWQEVQEWFQRERNKTLFRPRLIQVFLCQADNTGRPVGQAKLETSDEVLLLEKRR